MKWVFILLIFSIASCKTKGPGCIITSSEIIKDAPKKLLISYGTNQKIAGLYDPGWDSLKGGAYLFYPDDRIKSYTYYQNSKKPVYKEEYDENGIMVHSEGSPMVDRIITQVGTDSAFIRIYFFKLEKQFQNLKISINKNPSMEFPVVDDTVYSNLKVVSFGLNTSNLSKINMYSRIEYLNACSKINHVLTDSLFLIKNPDLSPAPPGSR